MTFGPQPQTNAEWRAAAMRERHQSLDGRHAPVVRPATASDTRHILKLIAESYDGETGLSQPDYWRWKHEDNPFGVSPCLVAESAGQLVGVRVFLRWNWYSGGRLVRAARAVDTSTSPAWRGRGVFSRLTMRLVELMQSEGVGFIYNTPNSKSMPGYLKMGWMPVTKIPLWIRPIRLSSCVARALTGRTAAEPSIATFHPVADVLQDARLPSFLADAAFNDDRYHTARTTRYLGWRYGMVPGVSYRARFEAVGDAGALVIARTRVRARLREVTISELLVTPSTRGVQIARALLSDVVRHADADYVAACAASGTSERRALIHAGFLPAPYLGPSFTARRLSTQIPDPTRWFNWRCSIGDLELF